MFPIKGFVIIYFFLIIYLTISGVKKPCLLYQGFRCVEVHYIEVSLYSSLKEISSITPHPLPTSCLELKLSCRTFLEKFYPLKNNVNPSLLDFLVNDPPSLCVATSHHPRSTHPWLVLLCMLTGEDGEKGLFAMQVGSFSVYLLKMCNTLYLKPLVHKTTCSLDDIGKFH